MQSPVMRITIATNLKAPSRKVYRKFPSTVGGASWYAEHPWEFGGESFVTLPLVPSPQAGRDGRVQGYKYEHCCGLTSKAAPI